MSTLIVLGNTNKFTFTNSIIAASRQSIALFQQELLTNIYVIHSKESYAKLHDKKADIQNWDWLEHLVQYGIDQECFTHRVVDIESTPDSVERFVAYIEAIIKGIPDEQKVIVDLSNSTTLHKTFLAIVAYILDLAHVYMIDIIKLFSLTSERGFIPADILERSYIPAPESAKLDKIAYLNLAEMIRYKRVIQQHTTRYKNILPLSSDEGFFKDNLMHSIQLKLRGDRKEQTDKAIYRIASSSISTSIEDLIRVLMDKFAIEYSDRSTFGSKIKIIEAKLHKDAPPDFDLEFFNRFNEFMLYLRNSTTHKGKLLTEVEKFKADLSVNMAFPFIEFYTEIVHNVLAADQTTEKPMRLKRLSDTDILPSTRLYYGLDGDNTGTVLEDLFCFSSDEKRFKALSDSIQKAIAKIGKLIREQTGDKNSVVFEAGDDLLFKGNFDRKSLEEMQAIYQTETAGLTCSIGYGSSFQEVYLALKLAKTQPNKNTIVGIQISS